VLCIEAGIDGVFMLDASEEEGGHHQQHKRNATCPGGACSPKLIRLRLRPTVRVSSLSISETEVPEERKAGTMPKTSPVKMETTKAKPNTLGLILRFGEVLSIFGGPQGPEKTDIPRTRTGIRERRKKTEQNAFGQQLTQQSAASGTKRHAHRDFLAASSGAREKQISHIGTRNEQYKSDDDHQQSTSEQ